ncbi:hypothetical protein DTB58_16250 [Streptomyces griseus]|nr:hypothetical protein [Streptomyces griseus]
MVVTRKEAGTLTSFDVPITIGLPPFTWTRVNETPPSAAPAGTAATAVNTAAAPPATATLQTCFPTLIPDLGTQGAEGSPPAPYRQPGFIRGCTYAHHDGASDSVPAVLSPGTGCPVVP